VSNVQDAIYGTSCVKNLWEPEKTFPKIQKQGDLSSRGSFCRRGGLCQQLSDAIGQLRAIANPIVDAVALQIDCRWVGAGIVCAHYFNGPAIAGAILFDNNDAIVGLLTRSNARQTDHQH
jgi:hypothetical protein